MIKQTYLADWPNSSPVFYDLITNVELHVSCDCWDSFMCSNFLQNPKDMLIHRLNGKWGLQLVQMDGGRIRGVNEEMKENRLQEISGELGLL